MSTHKAVRGPLRLRIPYLLDIVIVFAADDIRQIEQSDAVERLHAIETSQLPWWLRAGFPSTRYYDVDRDLWFCAFESATKPDYESRRAYQARQLARGYTPEDVRRIADLLRRQADDHELAHALAQVFIQRFVGREIPRSVIDAAGRTARTAFQGLLPWGRRGARRAQREVTSYCAHALSPDAHIADIGHHLGNAVHILLPAIRDVAASPDRPVEHVLAAKPPTPMLPRIAVKSSMLGGLLRTPTVPGKTVILYKTGGAAAETSDMLFVFGAGSPERYCTAKDLILSFMKDLQQELRGRCQPAGVRIADTTTACPVRS